MNSSRSEFADGSPIQFWPWRKRLRLAFDHNLRRSYRLFRHFPPLHCRYILDIGADRGTFADRAMRCFEVERVWLVEPNPASASALQKKYAAEPRCKVLSCAIVAKSGHVGFHVREHASSSTVQFEAAATQKSEATITVPARSLDDLFEQEQIEQVDLMKVDIQGAERMLIQGGAQALKRTRLIYIEVLFETSSPEVALIGELHDLLAAAGFKLRMLHRFRHDRHGYLLQADALYANTSQTAATREQP